MESGYAITCIFVFWLFSILVFLSLLKIDLAFHYRGQVFKLYVIHTYKKLHHPMLCERDSISFEKIHQNLDLCF